MIRIIDNKFVAKLVIKPLLKLHSFCYRCISHFAIILNNGVHPKHQIINYASWFLDKISYNWRIVDIGCGDGTLTFQLAQKASQIYGLDINSESIRKADTKNMLENTHYLCADATTFNYSHLTDIDCVVLSNILEHIVSATRAFNYSDCDKRDRLDFLKKVQTEIMWRFKPLFLIRVPMLERDWLATYKKNMGIGYKLDKTHKIEFTQKQIEDELKNAGLDIVNLTVRYGEIYIVAATKE